VISTWGWFTSSLRPYITPVRLGRRVGRLAAVDADDFAVRSGSRSVALRYTSVGIQHARFFLLLLQLDHVTRSRRPAAAGDVPYVEVFSAVVEPPTQIDGRPTLRDLVPTDDRRRVLDAHDHVRPDDVIRTAVT